MNPPRIACQRLNLIKNFLHAKMVGDKVIQLPSAELSVMNYCKIIEKKSEKREGPQCQGWAGVVGGAQVPRFPSLFFYFPEIIARLLKGFSPNPILQAIESMSSYLLGKLSVQLFRYNPYDNV